MKERTNDIKDVDIEIDGAWTETRANCAFVVNTNLGRIKEIRAFLSNLPETRIIYQKNSFGFLRVVEEK